MLYINFEGECQVRSHRDLILLKFKERFFVVVVVVGLTRF